MQRVLNEVGYHYFQSRQKGLLAEQDIKGRVKFCGIVRHRKRDQTFWNTMISFHLDGKGFKGSELETNSLDQTRATSR